MNLGKLKTADLKAKLIAKTVPKDQIKAAKELLAKREAKSKAAKPPTPLTAKQKENLKKPKSDKPKRIKKLDQAPEEIIVKNEKVKAFLVGKMHDKRNGYTYNRYRLVAHPTKVVHKKIDGGPSKLNSKKGQEDFI